MCDWNGDSKEKLKGHIQEKHIEQLKRKIIKEQQIKCYICGFQSSSETAFQIHTEERHNKKYSLHKDKSATKSPPTKKVKEHHDIDMDTDPLDIVKQKDEEIKVLKSTINQVQHKIQCFEDNLNKIVKPSAKLTSDNCTIDKTEKLTKFKFTEIQNCDKCDDVFNSKLLLEDHISKYHIETPIADTLEEVHFVCECVYPCIPVKGLGGAPMAASRRLNTQQGAQVSTDIP